jgi:hypothetical protein
MTNLTYSGHMGTEPPLVSTVDFSPAKAHLSDLMDDVFHRHRPQLVSRHRGKERMLLMRPDDLVAMLADERFDVQVVLDAGEVTLRIPGLGVLGFGDTLEEAIDDLIGELRVHVGRVFSDPTGYRSGRPAPPLALLRFALGDASVQRATLGLTEDSSELPVAAAR